MRVTVQRILGVAPVLVLAFLLSPSTVLAQERPDLTVTSLTGVPKTAFPGDAFVATATVLNQGPATSGATTTKFELVNANPAVTKKSIKGVQLIPSLLTGTSAAPPVTLAIYSDTLPGPYLVRACANNVAPKIPETSNLNNCFYVGPITILDVPDLAVTSVFEPPAGFKVPQGQPFTVSYTVENTGAVPPPAPFLVRFSLVAGATSFNLRTDDPETVQGMGPKGSPQAVFMNPSLSVSTKSDTPPGVYNLRVCADSGKTVSERNEDNNCKTSDGTVKVTAQPDLVVKSVTVNAPLKVQQGKPLSLRVVVGNNGLRDVSALTTTTMKFVLVSTDTPPFSKNLKGTVDVLPLAKQSEVTVDFTPGVYDDTVPGAYIVRVCIDSLKAVDEVLESNNCANSLSTVTVKGVPVSPADLKVTALTLPPQPAKFLPGQGFTLKARVENHGTAASPATTTRFYLVDAADVRTSLKNAQIVDPVAVGVPFEKDAINIQVYPGTAPGTYRVAACADGKKELHEVDEADNCFTSPATTAGMITVLKAPDLVATHVGDPPLAIRPGERFALTLTTVKNVGPEDALASTVKFFLVSTVDPTVRIDLDASLDVPPLASNAPAFIDPSTSVKVRAETVAGSYKAQACADGGKDILEGDEDDNCVLSTGTVQVAAVADLVVNAVRLPTAPVTVARGGTVALTAVVKNVGSALAAASSLRFSLVEAPGAAPIKKLREVVAVPEVPSGGRQLASATVIMAVPKSVVLGTAGKTYYVEACVDINDVVPEVSNANCGTSTDTIKVVE